ncbi:hypothetical protein J7F01_17725 [Streptomyces sp. ISL-22]|uniref:hypothetical protein n=1 Tax=unclassified Streptomyces TaxID=2593676 RepID=UPI001BEC181C|nr:MULTISPECIES: hypothetical protein [unclassified Streptomyces]MBT2420112.1 hypothetical protein [Streptomyces sp. ISL-24]MBT2433986.1 hypothetical protein [Streptomyces sp. ISL-22]
MSQDLPDQVRPHLQPGERLRQPPREPELERRLKSRLPGAVQRLLRPSAPKLVTRFER